LFGGRSLTGRFPAKKQSQKTRSMPQSLVNHIPQQPVNHAMKLERRWARKTAG
jgi:hypothetical protein